MVEGSRQRGWGRERGEPGGKEKGREIEMHEKNNPKTQQIWHLGTPIGGHRPCHTFQKTFSGTTFSSQIVCLYLIELQKQTILKSCYRNSTQAYLELLRIHRGATAPRHIFFRNMFSRATFASDILCHLASFVSYNASKMTIFKISQEQCNIFGIMALIVHGTNGLLYEWCTYIRMIRFEKSCNL